jgi:hypothetical protein
MDTRCTQVDVRSIGNSESMHRRRQGDMSAQKLLDLMHRAALENAIFGA